MAIEFPLQRILDKFNGRVCVDRTVTDTPCVIVGPEDLVELCFYLRDDEELGFDFMADICGVDFFPDTPRFQLVYQLFSIAKNWRVRIKCPLDDPPVAPTITQVWTTANWHEREAYDMYGIVFSDHPDLRRIYMWDGYDGFPMRRDYPLRGYKDEFNPMGAEEPSESGVS